MKNIDLISAKLWELKFISNYPRLYLSNYLADLKNQVDIECQTFIISQSESSESLDALYQAYSDQSKIIEAITSFEQECLIGLVEDTLEKSIRIRSDEVIGLIESKLNNLGTSGISEMDDLIFKALIDLQRTLFLNKSLVFRSAASEFFNNDTFKSLQLNIKCFGVLFVIEDEFIGERNPTKEYLLPKKFNKEDLKLVYLKQRVIEKHLTGTLDQPVNNIILQLNHQICCDLSGKDINLVDYHLLHGLEILENIKLSGNRLEEIFNLKSLHELQSIDLRGNQLEILHPHTFQGLMNLKSVHLDYNRLRTLPECLFQELVNLSDIVLYNNQIESLPAHLFKGLKNLKTILLANNQLTMLDNQIFKGLENLHTLILNNNRLTGIDPHLFSDLKKLKHLDISSNQLTTIQSRTFQGLECLSLIELYNNKLVMLHPMAFRGLAKLETILLDNNQLTRLHDQTFQGLANIREINLRLNNLTELNEFLYLFENLQSLEVVKIDEDLLNFLCSTRPLTTFAGFKRLTNF